LDFPFSRGRSVHWSPHTIWSPGPRSGTGRPLGRPSLLHCTVLYTLHHSPLLCTTRPPSPPAALTIIKRPLTRATLAVTWPGQHMLTQPCSCPTNPTTQACEKLGSTDPLQGRQGGSSAGSNPLHGCEGPRTGVAKEEDNGAAAERRFTSRAARLRCSRVLFSASGREPRAGSVYSR
jgi:hypothetical protein